MRIAYGFAWTIVLSESTVSPRTVSQSVSLCEVLANYRIRILICRSSSLNHLFVLAGVFELTSFPHPSHDCMRSHPRHYYTKI